MTNKILFSILVSFFSFTALFCKGQISNDKIVQISGVLMTSDSLRAVPYATIVVKNQDRGTYSSETGVFTMVLMKGDTIDISAIGFKPKTVVIPTETEGQYLSMIQLMTQDTFYLPETIIRPLPSPEEFDYAFRTWQVPDDQYELARKNTDALTLRALAYTLPKDGRENQMMYQRMQAVNATYYGINTRPTQLLNPLAWAEFIHAWKRGDYRRKK